jgi:hypothetical protein
MNVQKIFIASAAGAATLFASGYIIYVLLFGNSQIGLEESATSVMLASSDTRFSGIIVMELLYGLLLAATLNWKGTNGFGSGVIPGALIGSLIGFTFGLNLLSTTSLVSFNYVLFSGITYAVRYGLAGGVIALVYGKNNH